MVRVNALSILSFLAVLGVAQADRSIYDFIFETIGGKSHKQVAQAFGAVLLLAGIAATFFGQRALKQMRFVFGFTSMFLLGFWAMNHTVHDDTTLLSICAAAGLAFAVLSSFVTKAAYCAIAFAGAYMVSYASHLTIFSYFRHQTTTFYVTAGVVALVLLFLLSRAMKIVNLIIVAYAGAFAFITGVSLLSGQAFTAQHINRTDLTELDWSLLAIWVVLGTVGTVYQLFPSVFRRICGVCKKCRRSDQSSTQLTLVKPRSYVQEAPYFVAPSEMAVPAQSRDVGIANMGNTCFVNASLQALFSIPAVRQAYIQSAEKKDGGAVAQLFGSIMFLLQNSRFSSIKPRELREILKALEFNDGRQHDASEFLRCLINKIIDEDAESRKALKSTFGFQIQGVVHCHNCGAETQVLENSIDLCLQLPTRTDGGVHTINALMERAFKPSHFDGENKFFCDKCNGLQPAVRTTYIASLPQSLILTLNRFKYCYDTQVESKVMDAVSIPEWLNLNRYSYRLSAVIAHAGASMNCGHYYAFARADRGLGIQEWVRFDDDRVSVIPFDEVERVCSSSSSSGSAYVVIYSKATEV